MSHEDEFQQDILHVYCGYKKKEQYFLTQDKLGFKVLLIMMGTIFGCKWNVGRKEPDVSEKFITSIFRVEDHVKQENVKVERGQLIFTYASAHLLFVLIFDMFLRNVRIPISFMEL